MKLASSKKHKRLREIVGVRGIFYDQTPTGLPGHHTTYRSTKNDQLVLVNLIKTNTAADEVS